MAFEYAYDNQDIPSVSYFCHVDRVRPTPQTPLRPLI